MSSTEATHVFRADGSVRILSQQEREQVDRQVSLIVNEEWPELMLTVRRTCEEDRIGPTEGVLLVFDARGQLGRDFISRISGGRVNADSYVLAASKARRALPLVAHYLSADQATSFLPQINAHILPRIGSPQASAVRVVYVNPKDQIAIIHRPLEE